MIEAHKPTNFDRLAQGSAAREAMISRVKAMASTSVVAETTATNPLQFSNRRSRRASVFAAGALGVLSVGAAALSACGGGDSRSTGTPEGEVGGAQSNPTTGQTIEVKTAIASPTAKVEAPTATATSEVALTPDQVSEVISNVKELISTGLSENQVTKGEITLAGGDIRYPDRSYIAKAFDSCDFSKFGQPFYISKSGSNCRP